MKEKRALRFIVTVLVFSVAIFSVLFFATGDKPVSAQSSEEPGLSGYAWSSTIGWLSFDEQPTAGTTTINTLTGYINGFAWSPNIGWVQFGDLSGFPSGLGTVPSNARRVGNSIVGWARACAGTVDGDCYSADRTDGWDGWISLSGQATDVANSVYGLTVNTVNNDDIITGSAWGGVNVGWLKFNLDGISGPGVVITEPAAPALSMSVSPVTIFRGTNSNVTVYWTPTSLSSYSCTKTNTNSTGVSPNNWAGDLTSAEKTNGTKNDTVVENVPLANTLLTDITYKITCTKSGQQTITRQVVVSVNSQPINNTCTAPANSIACPNNGQTAPYDVITGNASNCPINPLPEDRCKFYCIPGFVVRGTDPNERCARASSIEEI